MIYEISEVDSAEYVVVADLWEVSVRETHDFLTEKDILYFKPRMFNAYLPEIDLRCCRDEDHEIIAFLGVEDHKIEMLFVHPDHFGKGIGKLLVNYAIEEMKIIYVDVNEQNHAALRFYVKMGFKTFNRIPLDGFGKPYPILNMTLFQ
ncbi:GNAT family N-acetyltransferase [Pedobacter metabolipauper]|uniref:Putative acetyltransferase n=1 Tax=Pedobacter metabolipauper TaxID=425513 RepID=A0A4R6SRV2_9SPHI|nr:GNAT family N-acetyltransferase [Pedobacter metabolipauper]TDQ07120.1 putative acetyltransferase [Pedobacter metabolipauper]